MKLLASTDNFSRPEKYVGDTFLCLRVSGPTEEPFQDLPYSTPSPFPSQMKLEDMPNLLNRPLMGLTSELGELTKSSSMSILDGGASVNDDVSDVYSLMSSITRLREGRWVRKIRVVGRWLGKCTGQIRGTGSG
jgi:hypothetical protein